jgi:hypothetical protein
VSTYIGNDFRRAYLPGVTQTGKGQTIALVSFEGFLQSDITAYESAAGLANVPVTPVLLDGYNGVPLTDNLQTETTLDIDMALSMAPGVDDIYVYEALSGFDGGAVDLNAYQKSADDEFAALANPPQGIPLSRQISASWIGYSGANIAAAVQQFAAQGQSFFIGAGDQGAFLQNNTIIAPANESEVSFMTVVGGTQLMTGPNATPWQSETTWNDGLKMRGRDGASGGGVVPGVPIPFYQKPLTNQILAAGGDPTLRNIPDVALTATDIAIYVTTPDESTGGMMFLSGTSAAAPLWAGFMALVNEQAMGPDGLGPVGFANPALYRLGQSPNYAADFHDIADHSTNDTNGGPNYTAIAGYDLATGWGTPASKSLIYDLAASAPPACAATCNGTCVDLDYNPNNCGACGHSCKGQACLGGQCQPLVLASGYNPSALAVDSASVYWTNMNMNPTGSSGVFKVPLNGGAVTQLSTTLYSAQLQGIGIAVDGTNVYWNDDVGSGGSLLSVPVGGGATTTLVSGTAFEDVKVDATNVYWAGNMGGAVNAGTIMKMPKSGGSPVTLVSGLRSPNGLAVDGTSVYWTDTSGSGTGTVRSVPVAGGVAVTLASGLISPFGIAVDGSSVYWNDQDLDFKSQGDVMKVPLHGGTSVTLASNQSIDRGAIAVDSQNVYWVARAAVMKAPIGGGTATVVWSGVSPWGLAIDGTSVYFMDQNYNLMKLAK